MPICHDEALRVCTVEVPGYALRIQYAFENGRPLRTVYTVGADTSRATIDYAWDEATNVLIGEVDAIATQAPKDACAGGVSYIADGVVDALVHKSFDEDRLASVVVEPLSCLAKGASFDDYDRASFSYSDPAGSVLSWALTWDDQPVISRAYRYNDDGTLERIETTFNACFTSVCNVTSDLTPIWEGDRLAGFSVDGSLNMSDELRHYAVSGYFAHDGKSDLDLRIAQVSETQIEISSSSIEGPLLRVGLCAR